MTTDQQYYRLAMRIFADFSGSIAIPAVLAALFGKWMDTRYSTSPRYLIVFLVLAFFFTTISVKRKSKRYADAYQKLINNETKKSK